jgi:hypothetical protein
MRKLGIVARRRAGWLCVVRIGHRARVCPPVMYQSYNCQQLGLEAQGISQRAAALSGTQDSRRTKDGLVTAAAIVVLSFPKEQR